MNTCSLCEWQIKVNYVTDEDWTYTCNDCHEESIRDKSNDYYGIIQRNKRKAEKLNKESLEMWNYEEIMKELA